MESCLAIDARLKLWGKVVEPGRSCNVAVPEGRQLWLRQVSLASDASGPASINMTTYGEGSHPPVVLARLSPDSLTQCARLGLEIR